MPFFLYASEVMGRGTVAQRVVDVVQAGLGRAPGGLAITSVGTSAIFGPPIGPCFRRSVIYFRDLDHGAQCACHSGQVLIHT